MKQKSKALGELHRPKAKHEQQEFPLKCLSAIAMAVAMGIVAFFDGYSLFEKTSLEVFLFMGMLYFLNKK